MQDIDKSKGQLATEVVQLRQRIAELEAASIERKQAKETLRKSKERERERLEELEAIMYFTPAVIFIAHDPQCRQMTGNRMTHELLRLPEGANVSKSASPEEQPRNFRSMRNGQEIPADQLPVQQAAQGREVRDYELDIIFEDGKEHIIFGNATPLRDTSGKPRGAVGVFMDITERKRAEEKLRESEEKYRSVVERSNDGIVIIQDGKLKYVNPIVSKIVGYTVEEAIDTPFTKYIHPDELPQAVDYHKRRMAGDKQVPVRYERGLLHKNGSRINTEIDGAVITYEGKLADLVIIRDISERKRSEEELRKSEARYRTLIDNIELGINLIDANHNIVMVNASMGEKYNKPVNELIGKKCFQEFEKRDAVCSLCPGVLTMATGKPAEAETEGVRDDQSRFHVRLQTFPVVDQDGRVTAFIEIAEDITERKRIENALRESEEEYRSLVESSDDSIYLVDRESTYLFMNKRHLSRLGLKRSQVIGSTYGEFHSPEETKDFAQRVEKVLMTGKALSYEYRSQRDNRYFIRTLSPVKSPKAGKPAVITVISKDITQLKQTEEVLRRREQEIRVIADNVPALVSYLDASGCYRFANQQYKDWFGFPRKEIIGKHCSQVLGKATFDLIKDRVEAALAGHRVCFEAALPYAHGGARWVLADYVPDADDRGKVNGFFALVTDITKRKRAEELLQRERDTLFAILQKAPYGVVLLDKEGKTILINMEFTNITGYTREDIPTLKDWLRLAYPNKKYRDTVIDILTKDITVGSDDKIFHETYHRTFFRTFKITCKDGTIKEIEFRPTALEDGGTIVMIADITERKRMHELLETAATEWRTTFDAISDAVCLFDQKGRIKRCNNAMIKMIGKTFSEITDRICWEVLYGASKMPEGSPFASVLKSHHRETGVILRNNRWLNISIDPLLDENGNLVGGVHITSDITERIQAEEELQSSREELRNLAVYLESVREQERTNIAREIHDELAQSLTALKMDLAWLDNKVPRDQIPFVEKIHAMNELIDSIIQTVKRISAALRPGILDDLGLVAAIEWQAEEFQNRTGINCRFAVNPDDLTVDQDRSTAIFRIFQETLTNIARHASASLVSVDLLKEIGSLMLLVIDNGTGITEEQIHDPKSFGLIGMRERVHPWGGLVNIKGIPGQGTTVEVRIPLEKE
jgi:PAS domain S-box-containing protein